MWSVGEISADEKNERKEEIDELVSQKDEWRIWKEMKACFHDKFKYKDLKFQSMAEIKNILFQLLVRKMT